MMEEAYKNYKLKHNFQINQGIEILCQEEFIHSIKTDDEFAKTWDVKVEVRELSLEERTKILDTKENSNRNTFAEQEGFMSYVCDKHNIPTKEISLTYDNQTEVIYE
jgi:hypothetical protein